MIGPDLGLGHLDLITHGVQFLPLRNLSVMHIAILSSNSQIPAS